MTKGELCMIHDKRCMLHDDAPWLPGSLPEGAGGQAGTEAAEEEQCINIISSYLRLGTENIRYQPEEAAEEVGLAKAVGVAANLQGSKMISHIKALCSVVGGCQIFQSLHTGCLF